MVTAFGYGFWLRLLVRGNALENLSPIGLAARRYADLARNFLTAAAPANHLGRLENGLARPLYSENISFEHPHSKRLAPADSVFVESAVPCIDKEARLSGDLQMQSGYLIADRGQLE